MSEFSSLNGYDVKDKVARSIAKGRNQAVAFGNYSTLITALNSLRNDEFNVGQNIYIVTVGVPDLWVSSVESTLHTFNYVSDEDIVQKLKDNGTIQAGYYRLSTLEVQKVDLTTYDQEIANLKAKDTQLTNAVNGKAPSSHTHDDRYYTESEVDTKLSAIPVLKSKIIAGITANGMVDTGITTANHIVSVMQTKGANSTDAEVTIGAVVSPNYPNTTYRVSISGFSTGSGGGMTPSGGGSASITVWYI